MQESEIQIIPIVCIVGLPSITLKGSEILKQGADRDGADLTNAAKKLSTVTTTL
jgi:hypothetical protein